MFDRHAQDLRAVSRITAGHGAELATAIVDSRILRSTPESGPRAGYHGGKHKRGSKLHMSVVGMVFFDGVLGNACKL